MELTPLTSHSQSRIKRLCTNDMLRSKSDSKIVKRYRDLRTGVDIDWYQTL